jgi:hypothetical protein
VKPSVTAAVAKVPEAYVAEPPVIRERQPSLELELADDDIVEEEPVALVRRSTPPPPPPARKSSAPPPAPVAVAVAPVVAAVPAYVPPPVVASPPPPSAPPPVSTVRDTPVPASGTRASIPDPTDVLFDAMYELSFIDSSWQAADVCAGALAKALGARAIVIHMHDLARREIRAIGACGPRSHEILGSFEPSEDDFVASAAICNGKPVTMKFDGELPRLAPSRLGIVGAARSLVAVPVLAWGRCVALIEIVDADDAYATRVVDAVAYVSERLAEFLSARAAA